MAKKKIYSIELKEVEIVPTDENSDDFIEVVKNRRKYPVFLTNYALSRGYDMGLLKSTLVNDLVKIQSDLETTKTKGKDEEAKAVIGNIDEKKMLDVIYLAFVGANPKSTTTKEEFLQQYHANYQEKVVLYFNIIAAAVDADPNLFAQGLEKSQAKPDKNEKK